MWIIHVETDFLHNLSTVNHAGIMYRQPLFAANYIPCLACSILLAAQSCERLVVLKLDDMQERYEAEEQNDPQWVPAATGRGPAKPLTVTGLPRTLEVLRTSFPLALTFTVETEPRNLRVFEGVSTRDLGLTQSQTGAVSALISSSQFLVMQHDLYLSLSFSYDG